MVLTGCIQQEKTEWVVVKHEEKQVTKEIAKEEIVHEGEKEIVPQPYHIAEGQRNIDSIQFDRFLERDLTESINLYPEEMFPEVYTEMEGVLTFRGSHLRDQASFGKARIKKKKLEQIWVYETSSIGDWGGGAGWTGQGSVIKWDETIKRGMNLIEPYKSLPDFIEVIQPSLDGRIYFLDLKTGKKTREPITIHNPIKGSVSLDPRGYPLLYVGQGIRQTKEFGYRIYSLIDGNLLHFINGMEPLSYREWAAFDGAPLINKDTDRMYLGGENGILYQVKLNTDYQQDKNTITIKPETTMYRYNINGNKRQGIESSVAAYRNLLYFADNGGSVQALDIREMRPVWALGGTDDTDATLVVDVEDNGPKVYTGTEVDFQGAKGYALIRKLDGLTGSEIWREEYEAYSIIGDHPVNGGLLATPVSGKEQIRNLIIFTIARVGDLQKGLMVALEKNTGNEIWRKEMDNYSWSSPVDIYTEAGESYLIQGDSIGQLHLIDAKTGQTLHSINLGANIEASPVIYKNVIVVSTRGGYIYGVEIK